jgi:hypothetical protein
MNLAWLAAVITPRDIAPHPNFIREEQLSTPGMLALLFKRDSLMFYRLMEQRPDFPSTDFPHFVPPEEVDRRFLEAVQLTIGVGSVEEGVIELQELLLGNQLHDHAWQSATTLIACLGLAELDDYDAIIRILENQLSSWQSLATLPEIDADHRLLSAFLLQQLGMRRAEAGLDGRPQSRSVLELLEAVDPATIDDFPLTQSVSWTSRRTVENMISALNDSAMSSIADMPFSAPNHTEERTVSWQDLIMAEPDQHLLLMDSTRADAYEADVKERYRDKLSGGVKGVFGATTIDEDIYAAQTAYEFTGHPAAPSRRRELAQLRLLRADATTPPAVIQDSLRLLRHSGDRSALDIALSWVTRRGPLAALSGDAKQVLSKRRQAERLRGVEVRVLQAAAQVLDTRSASDGVSAILEAIRAGMPAVFPGHWEAYSTRIEAAWLAVAALSNVAGRVDDVAREFLSAAGEQAENELIDLSLARAARELDWSMVSDTVRSAWVQWLTSTSAQRVQPNLTDVINTHLDGVKLDIAYDEITLTEVARMLNLAMRGDADAFTSDSLRESTKLVIRSLQNIREESGRGHFSGGGLSTTDIAVGLALYAKADNLWPEIASVLTDPAVQRDETASAFERLARDASRVPTTVRSALRDRMYQVLYSTKDLWQTETITPYPAALRLLIAAEIIDLPQSLTYTVQLSGSDNKIARAEAARVLTTLSRIGQDPWVVALTLQLSYDSDSQVRAEAGRALALLLKYQLPQASFLIERLLFLLHEDGILVPLLILRGLHESRAPVPERVIQRINAIATGHAAYGVRLQAASLAELLRE